MIHLQVHSAWAVLSPPCEIKVLRGDHHCALVLSPQKVEVLQCG